MPVKFIFIGFVKRVVVYSFLDEIFFHIWPSERKKVHLVIFCKPSRHRMLYGFYAAFLPICGLFALTTLISANTFVQTTVPGHLRGRVMGLYLLIFMGGTPFGAPLVGWMADLIGVRQSVAACGLITALAAAIIYFTARKRLASISAA